MGETTFTSTGERRISSINSITPHNPNIGCWGLDALAHHWHLSGLNAMSVQWGPWLEVGMAVPCYLICVSLGSRWRCGNRNFVVVVVVVVVVSYFVKDLHIIFNGYACPFLLTWSDFFHLLNRPICHAKDWFAWSKCPHPRHKTTPSHDWRSMASATSHLENWTFRCSWLTCVCVCVSRI